MAPVRILAEAVTIATLIIIAIAIALDPLPLVPYILLLTAKRGLLKAAAFLFGWFASLAAVVIVPLVATGGQPVSSGSLPAWVALAAKLVIGGALLWIGLRKRKQMQGPPKPKAVPKWQSGVDSLSPWFAIGLAPLTQPWGLIAAGVTEVMNVDLANGAAIVLLVAFVVLASSSYLFLALGAAFRPERAAVWATSIRDWIQRHTDQAIVVGSIGIGLFLVISAVVQMITSA